MTRSSRLAAVSVGLGTALAPTLAGAHGIGELYATPIPLKFYLLGAGYAVAASFLMLTFLLRGRSPDPPASVRQVPVTGLRWVIATGRLTIGMVIVLVVLSGFFGTLMPGNNLAPWLFWICVLVGLTLMSLLAGNSWERLNPLRFAVDLWERVDPVPSRRLVPAFIGPAALFLLFWWELVSGTSFRAATVSSVILVYSLVTLIGGRVFDNWFRDADPLSLMFRLVGSISPLRIGKSDRSIEVVSWKVASIGAGWPVLLATGTLLGGASFDSLQESVLWFDWLRLLRLDGVDRLIWGTGGLALTVAFFVGSYLVAIYAMAVIVRRRVEWRAFVFPFVGSLIPVIVGYTLAHNFPLTILMLPKLVVIASDPLHMGWDLFGTASFDPGLIVSARFVWFVEIALVILGHVGGVRLAHVAAQRVFPDPAVANRSQYPMAVLMVGYTVLTLWLLAQPLVVSP